MVTSLFGSADPKEKIGNDFSRWSLGVNGGISAFRGDMISFRRIKLISGVQGGLQLGYQFTPTSVCP